MSDLILTKNLFLKNGVESLKLTYGFRTRFVFIDLDSYHSLGDILNALRNEKIVEDFNVCLIGTCCVNYKILKSFEPIALSAPISRIKTVFSTRRFHKVSELVRYIYSVERLSMLTSRERQCLLAFQKGGNVNVASTRMRLAEKTIYTVLRNAGNKINLNRLLQMREFLSTNSYVLNER